MSDNIDAEMHQKHENRLTQAETQIQGLTQTTVRIEANVEKVDGKCEDILNAINANNRNGNKSELSSVKTYAGLALGVLVGFMTLVILPMQESIDKRRLEQDEKNKLHSTHLKAAEDRHYQHAVDVAYKNGEQDSKLECMQNQLNAIDYTGPRGATK
jgi:hypothetical protein